MHPHGIDGTSLHLLVLGHFPAETFVISPEGGRVTLTTNIGAIQVDPGGDREIVKCIKSTGNCNFHTI